MFIRSWNETTPLDTQAASLLGQNLRHLQQDIRERLVACGAGTLAERLDFEAEFGSATAGVMYFAHDTGQIFYWDGTAWVDVTADFIIPPPPPAPVPDEEIIFLDSTDVVAAPGVFQFVVIPGGTLVVDSIVEITAAIQLTGAGIGNSVSLTLNNVTIANTIVGDPNAMVYLRATVIVTGEATQKALGFGDNGVQLSGGGQPSIAYVALTADTLNDITVRSLVNVASGTGTGRFLLARVRP